MLKEEKRLLKLQLKAKNSLRDSKTSPGAHELSVSSTTGVSTGGSSLSLASSATPLTSELTGLAGTPHLGDESPSSQANQATTSTTSSILPHSPHLSRPSASLIKLQPLKVEELAIPGAPTSSSSGPVRPSKLEALQASRSGTSGTSSDSKSPPSRVRRAVPGGVRSETDERNRSSGMDIGAPRSSTSSRGTSNLAEDQSVSLLKDELWDEKSGQPAYKKELTGPGGHPSDKALGDYFTDVSVNPEPVVIPK